MTASLLSQVSPDLAEAAIRIAAMQIRARRRLSDPHSWRTKARAAQLPPGGAWLVWYIIGGRGGGKTWTAGHTFAEWLLEDPGEYGIVAPTYSAAKSVCIEGTKSGLLAALGTSRTEVDRGASRHVLSWNRSSGELRLRNGTVVYVESAEEGAPDIQGHNLKGAWASEIGLWRRWKMAWEESLRYAVRLGRARIVADGTPKRGHGLVRMLVEDQYVPKSRLRTLDNLENLNPVVVQQWQRQYGGTSLGRQELEGELLEDVPGAIWKRTWIDDARILPDEEGGFIEPIPAFSRIVVGLDPATTSAEGADDTGIVAAAAAMHEADNHEDRPHEHYYVLEDISDRMTPAMWGDRAVALYRRSKADRIVGETNRGGETIGHTLRTVDANVSFKPVHAMRGKTVRAEPIAALYEQGKVHHVGFFTELEDQMCSYVAGDPGSPDRMDALVWALTDLAVKDEPGLLGMYRTQAAKPASTDAATAAPKA